ncbi:plus-3-domain-containing protein [Xylariomycetidae sp. FL0641]|nr:plus-3-domain-containing protein [Xylariomycetidae sp. FL0641]
MADVDDELLALVGGDDGSDEEVEQEELNSNPSPSQSPEPEKQKAKKTTPAPKSKKRRQDDSDEEEEGEASSGASSPASQQSAPMDESDSESDNFQFPNTNGKTDDDDDVKYPVEGIYASEAEKEEILAMPELDREQLIAKRQEEIDRQRQNNLLRQLLKNREDDSQSAKKRKASNADLDDAQRKTSRQRTRVGGSKVGETSAGIESLRRARAEKSDRLRRREEDRERNKGRSGPSRNSPDEDGDGDSDVDWAGSRYKSHKSQSPEIKVAPLAELRDFERIRLSRSRFAEVCFYPGFDETITGCYVRISLGPSPGAGPTGPNVYRMAVIKGFVQGKPYAMDKPNGQRFVTDQYIRAAHGKAERDWPFIVCSDSPFTEAEFSRYQRICQEEGVPFPKKPSLSAKIDDINALRSRTWTDAEVNEKIEREMALRRKFNSPDRERLAKKLEEAKQNGDDARVAELQDQLDSIGTPRLAFRTSLSQSKPSTPSAPSQQDRLALLNAENRRRNSEAVRKAQMKERTKVRKIETPGARGDDAPGGTPRGGSGASTPANGTPKPSANIKSPALSIQNQPNGKDKKGVPQIHKPLMDDDIIGALDLDLEVDID